MSGPRIRSVCPYLQWLLVVALFSMPVVAHESVAQDDPEPHVIPAEQVEPDPDTEGEPDIQPDVVAFEDYNDPLIRMNRAIFRFNDVSYRYVLIPAARAYEVVPQPARRGIANFFTNIRAPIDITNHLLQGEAAKAGNSTMGFLVNSTIGLAGLFDPATHWLEIERERATAGSTMARHGAGYGAYIVLPFIGPSNIRDGSGMFVDSFLNPLRYVVDDPESMAIRVFGNFQEYTPMFDAYMEVRKQSEDPYIFLRNMHLQGLQRDAEQ